jgi:hypothetical protein
VIVEGVVTVGLQATVRDQDARERSPAVRERVGAMPRTVNFKYTRLPVVEDDEVWLDVLAMVGGDPQPKGRLEPNYKYFGVPSPRSPFHK